MPQTQHGKKSALTIYLTGSDEHLNFYIKEEIGLFLETIFFVCLFAYESLAGFPPTFNVFLIALNSFSYQPFN